MDVKTKQHYCPLKQDHPNAHFRLIEMCNQIPPIIYLAVYGSAIVPNDCV